MPIRVRDKQRQRLWSRYCAEHVEHRICGETIGMDTPTVPNEKIARSAGWTISPTDQGAWSRLFICAGHQLGQIPNTM